MKLRKSLACLATACGLTVPLALNSVSPASAYVIIDGSYGCSGAYPWHANTVIGNGDHVHKISYMSVHYLHGGFTNNKSIWPQSSSYKIAGSSLRHVLNNTQAPSGSGSVYCRS